MKKIPLVSGQYVTVDDGDYERLSKYKWYYSSYGYAVGRMGGNKLCQLSRIIINAPKHLKVDHINQDKLDNRKSNLRLCNDLQNSLNRKKFKISTSIYKGVCWDKQNNKWESRISLKGKKYRIGFFENERHAALAYDMWAKDLHGMFSSTNFN